MPIWRFLPPAGNLELEEITNELTRLIAMGRKFGITAADIKRLINQLEEK